MKFDKEEVGILGCNFVAIAGNTLQNIDYDQITSLLGFLTAIISFVMAVVLLILKIRKAIKAKNLDAFMDSTKEFEQTVDKIIEKVGDHDEYLDNGRCETHDGHGENQSTQK